MSSFEIPNFAGRIACYRESQSGYRLDGPRRGGVYLSAVVPGSARQIGGPCLRKIRHSEMKSILALQ